MDVCQKRNFIIITIETKTKDWKDDGLECCEFPYHLIAFNGHVL